MPLQPYFEQDGVTLYHGDCREILHELESESFDLVLTDPPYLVSYSGRWGSDWGVIEGDSDPSWIAPVFVETWRLLKPDSLCLTFYGWPHADLFLGAWKLIGFRPVSLVVLIKDRWGLGQFTRAQHEHAYILAKGHPQKPRHAISDVLHWDQVTQQLHPNQKPLGAIAKLVATTAPKARASSTRSAAAERHFLRPVPPDGARWESKLKSAFVKWRRCDCHSRFSISQTPSKSPNSWRSP